MMNYLIKKLRFWLILDDFMDYFSMVNTIKIPYFLQDLP